jgi:hypothetical protein
MLFSSANKFRCCPCLIDNAAARRLSLVFLTGLRNFQCCPPKVTIVSYSLINVMKVAVSGVFIIIMADLSQIIWVYFENLILL